MANGTFQSCDGAFLDTGGGGANYQDSEQFTTTICPSTPGDVVTVDFQIFSLDQIGPNANAWDFMEIYDGDNVTAPYLGIYYGTDLQGLYVTGTPLNTTGCLTFVFRSNGDGQTGNIAATITCATPCTRPVAVASDNAPVSNKICIGDEITFNGSASYAAAGFSIVEYLWNFADGTTALGPIVSKTFDVPGEYVVELFLTDDNGCASTNRVSLQILVGTIPDFNPFPSDTTLCLGESLTLTALPTQYEVTWAGPDISYTNDNQLVLEDVVGESYPSEVEVTGFSPGQTITAMSDLQSIGMEIEHSWLYDLLITITCPSGQSVILHQQMLLPDGTTVGANGADFGIANGDPYFYEWAADATLGVMAAEAQNVPGAALPEGVYSSLNSLEALVGCDLNGTWTLEITDLWGGDDGTLSQFTLAFNPAILPDVTVFTPQIGGGADSSFWTIPQGAFTLDYMDPDLDIASFTPTAVGQLEFIYTVFDDFTCENVDTVTVTIEQALLVSAGPDQLFACETVTLEGGFIGQPAASCSDASGDFTYCYSDGDNFEWTFCPDNPGDDVTMMTFAFVNGQMENGFEDLFIYDGPDSSSPLIELWSSGDASGMSWTATNPSGCITIAFTADGSVSCGGGSYNPWQYTVSCNGGGPQYVWEWSPINNLTSPLTPITDVTNITNTTTYTLTGYPVGHPLCVSSDDVVVLVDPLSSPGTDNDTLICPNSTLNLIDVLLGSPVDFGTWTDATGTVLANGFFDASVQTVGDYTYTVSAGDCDLTAVVSIDYTTPLEIEAQDAAILCSYDDIDIALVSMAGGSAPFEFQWSYNGIVVSGEDTFTYDPSVSGDMCVDVIDGCSDLATACFALTVDPEVVVAFTADTTRSCWPESFNLQITSDPSTYVGSQWSFGDGNTLTNSATATHNYNAPGTYDISLALTTTNGCLFSATSENMLTSLSAPDVQWAANPQPTNIENTTITFTDYTIGSDISEYRWIFNVPSPMGVSSEANPVFDFPAGVGGIYPVQLIVTDINGCIGNLTANVIINDLFQFYIPNSFTPNNDGVNDVFRFEGTDINADDFYLKVFNRWGEVVFQTNNPSVPWTGDAQNTGYFAPDGVYTWIAKVTSESTGEKKEISGSITMFR